MSQDELKWEPELSLVPPQPIGSFNLCATVWGSRILYDMDDIAQANVVYLLRKDKKYLTKPAVTCIFRGMGYRMGEYPNMLQAAYLVRPWRDFPGYHNTVIDACFRIVDERTMNHVTRADIGDGYDGLFQRRKPKKMYPYGYVRAVMKNFGVEVNNEAQV